MTITEAPAAVLNGGPTIAQRQARLADGAHDLAGSQGRHAVLHNERFLLTVAATLMPVGVVAIVLGWFGAARSTLAEEQLPYLISGGLVGLALSTIGAVTLFSHWLTVLIRENRRHEAAREQDHEELLQAVRRLGSRQEGSNGSAGGPRPQRPLRRAARGS